MKTKIVFFVSIIVISSIAIFISCKKETNSKKLNGIYIVPLSGTSVIDNKVLLYSSTPYQFPLAAAILSPITANIDLTIAVDNSIIDAYNKMQNTNYAAMPNGSYSLAENNLTIPMDSTVSQQTNLIIKADMLTTDVSYLLPVKITSQSSSDITLNSAIATKYYVIRVPTPVIGNLSDRKNSYWKNPAESYNPSRGNDGNTDGIWGNGSVCESGAGSEQYWEVDLGATSPRIDTIRIWNRTDCCSDRTSKFYVFISDEPFSGTTVASSVSQAGVYKYYQEDPAGYPTEIYPKVSGRYIRLQNTTGASLTLAELTAIGIKP